MYQTQHRVIRKPEKRLLSGLADSTTERLEKKGEFPTRIHLTGGHVGWWLDEVLSWLESRPRGSARSTAAATSARQAKLQRSRLAQEARSAAPIAPQAAEHGALTTA